MSTSSKENHRFSFKKIKKFKIKESNHNLLDSS